MCQQKRIQNIYTCFCVNEHALSAPNPSKFGDPKKNQPGSQVTNALEIPTKHSAIKTDPKNNSPSFFWESPS